MKTKNVYSLPMKKDTVFLAVSDPRAHRSHWKHSVDFAVDFNVPILAALDGEVVDVKDDSKEGGNDKKFADEKYQNFITIKHANDELSQYGHIAHKSSLVKVGDQVKRGDPIAKGIGMVGYTTAPHLHLMVCFDTENEVGFESLEMQLDTEIEIIRDGKKHAEKIAKPRYKRLRELQEKYA